MSQVTSRVEQPNTNPPPAAAAQPNGWDAVQQVALRVIQSPLFWTASAGCIAIVATALHALPLAGFALATSVTLFFLFKGPITAEVKLTAYRVYYYFKNYPWYSQITPHLYIGGAPLQNAGHLEGLSRLQITLIVNLALPYEIRMQGIFHEHVPQMAGRIGRVYFPLAEGEAAPIAQHLFTDVLRVIAGGGRVYLHDLVGDGRCVYVAEAYLINQRINEIRTEQAAFEYIRAHYPQASRSAEQRAAIEAYAQTLAS